MAITADRVIVELEAKIGRYNADVRRAERGFTDATNNMERRAGALSSSVSAAMRGISGALAGVSVVALAREFLGLADASKQIEARLRLATKTFGTYGQAQADTERLAAETRSGLVSTAILYGDLARATAVLGGTQADTSRATETFAKALKIGGADTATATQATRQFGQALASGVLRGDEFNTIAEASPRILQLLAEALGKPRGELRALAEDGKLTSNLLFKALTDKRYTAGIDEEFRTLPLTFSDAMQQVNNAAITTFGAFDRGGQFSTALANFVTDGADGFQSLSDGAAQTGIEIRAVFAGLSNAFQPMADGAASAFGSVVSNAEYARQAIASLLGVYDKLANIKVSGSRTAEFLARGQNLIDGKPASQGVGSTPYSNTAGEFLRSEAVSRRRGEARERQRKVAQRLERQGFVVPLNRDGSVNEAAITKRVNPPAQPISVKAPKPKAGPKGPSAATLANRAEAARMKALRDDEAFENEKYGLNQDLLRARRSTAVAADAVAAFELQEIESARVRQNQSYARDVSEKKLTQARADELTALNDKVAIERASVVRSEADEQKRAARSALMESDLNNARDLAAAEGALATTAEQRRQSALRLLDLEYQLERARLEAVVAAKATTESEIAQQEAARRRLALLPQLQAADTTATNRDNEGPLARYRRGFDDPKTQVEQAVADKLEDVNQGITDAISNKLGIKDPLLKQLLKTFIEQNVLKPLYDAMAQAGTGGGGGGIGGFLTQAIGLASSAFGGGGHTMGGAPISNDLFRMLSAGNGVGRASGGYVGPGQLVRVNEGGSPGNVEGWRPAGSGTVIPLGQMKAATSSGGTTIVHAPQFNLKGAILTRELYADMQRISQQSAVAAGKASYKQALNDGPGRLDRFSKLGS